MRLLYLALAYSPHSMTLLLFAFPIAYSLIGMQRIRLVSKTYTFCVGNVYVSSVKRIRFGHETYTFSPHKVYVLPPQPFPAPPRTMVSPSATSIFGVHSEAVLLALCLCRRRAFIVPLGINNQSIS